MERSIGFLEGVSGHTYDTIYDLLFTTERVIAIIVQHPTEVPYRFGVTEVLFGGSFTRRRERFDRKKAAEERLRSYQEKTFGELLGGHPFNFEILFDKVATVELIRGLFQTHLKFQINGPSTPGRTLHFTLAKNQITDAHKLLKTALPLNVKES